MADAISCDLAIAGAGIVGLWLAHHATQAGLKVALIDRGTIGAGASGGILGALMPHAPENWNGKKQFQFDALLSLERAIAALERDTGLPTGYRRTGRLMPLANDRQRKMALMRERAAAENWRSGERSFDWRVVGDPGLAGWIAPDAAAAGAVLDDLSARVDPRALLAALRAGLARGGRAIIIENDGVIGWRDGAACFVGGRRVKAGHLAVTAGNASFPLLASLFAIPPRLGRPVKGQAALLAAAAPPGAPILFDNGLYVVPHADGRVAVGSTSEDEFDDPFGTDHRLDAVIERARALCPALRDAPVLERWAGLRPRAAGRDPLIDRLPGYPKVIVATGGFKITFGIAHEMARAALELMAGREPRLPESFRLEHHLVPARKD